MSIAETASLATLAVAAVTLLVAALNLVVAWRYSRKQTRLAEESGKELAEMRSGLESLRSATENVLAFQQEVDRRTQQAAVANFLAALAIANAQADDLLQTRYAVETVKEIVTNVRIEEEIDIAIRGGIVFSPPFQQARNDMRLMRERILSLPDQIRPEMQNTLDIWRGQFAGAVKSLRDHCRGMGAV